MAGHRFPIADRPGASGEIVEPLLEGAFAHADAGRLAEAESVFRAVLALDPLRHEPFLGLGMLALSVQNYEAARDLLAHALRLAPASARCHYVLGRLARAQDDRDGAERWYRRAVERDPRLTPGWISLGIVLREAGRRAEAVECYARALDQDPSSVETHVNLLNLLREEADEASSRATYERLLARFPASAEIRYYYGTHLAEAGRQQEAMRQFEAAAALEPSFAREAAAAAAEPATDRARLEALLALHLRVAGLRPDSAEAHYNVGMTLRDLGDREAALEPLRRAVELRPDYFEGVLGLGRLALDLYHLDQAVEFLREAERLRPKSVAALNGLASALLENGAASEAVAACRRALAHEPDHAESHLVLANALLQARRLDDACEHYRVALERVDAGNAHVAFHNLLFSLNYSQRVGGEALADEHRRLGERFAPPPPGPVAFDLVREPERRLRVGYVSSDFRSHAVALFFEPILANHDRDRFEIACYHTWGGRGDGVTELLRGAADRWVPCAPLSDHDLARRIREDRIDVLVDLAGNTGGNRLFTFARRAAPVQITMLGYPTTTGIAAIDYRVTDRHVDPPGWEPRSSERLLRMPASYYCYRPRHAPAIAAEPPSARGPTTFGSFNNIAKASDAALDLWAAVLRRAPEARLVLKHKGYGDAGTRAEVVTSFAERGVDAARLELVSWVPSGEAHLDWYNRIDVALDSFPYGGGTTTCEAIWMGVPVVTLAGDTHASRMGCSILSAAGAPELVARTPEEYVSLATALAADPARLRGYRAGLRDQVARSALRDEVRYTRALEDHYRGAWRSWCERP
jgi:predicted O-linked N-acetylglucosamine transferase (SPINDLY family)